VLPREATLRGSPSPRLPSHQLTEFALVLNLSLLAGNKRRGVPSETLQKRTGDTGRSQSLGADQNGAEAHYRRALEVS
jgi:hypothetical protein